MGGGGAEEESSPWLRTERVFLHAGEFFFPERERVLHELFCRWMRSRSVCSGLFFFFVFFVIMDIYESSKDTLLI